MGKKLSRSARGGMGKSKRPVTLPAWDFGASGPANRAGLVQEDAFDQNPNRVKRARRVDMLERWHKLGKISTAGYNAAEKLRDAFEATQRAPGWPDNDRVQSSPKPDHAVTVQIDRLSKYHDIARHIAREDRHVIYRCVLLREEPADFSALRTALDRLARKI